MTAASYAQRALQFFVVALIVLIYNPWGIAYGGKTVPDAGVRYFYLFLLFGFFVSLIAYVALVITENAEVYLENIKRKPAEDKEEENEMQPLEVLALAAYPLMVIGFKYAADLMLKKTGLQLYGVGAFFNPFRDFGGVHKEISNNGIEMQTMQTGGFVQTMSDHIMSTILVIFSWFVFVFNFGSVASFFFTDNWRSLGGLLVTLIFTIGAFVYHVVKIDKGDVVIPMGSMTPFISVKRFIEVFVIGLVGSLLIGYPINPLLEKVREKIGPMGYFIPIISSLGTILFGQSI